MKVVFLVFGEKVATWRTLWPSRELRRRGYEVSVYGSAVTAAPKVEPTEDVTYVIHVINKVWRAETGQIFTIADVVRWARSFGRVILSLDDDWTKMLHIQQGGPDALARETHARIPEMIRLADRVIVATPRLAEVYGAWAREVVLVENTLPEWVLGLDHPEPLDRLVWMGEMYIHGGDWNLLQPYARDLPPLYLVGTGERDADRVRSWGVDVVTTKAIFNQRKLYREMGRGVGAIVPLADTAFNRGKSWSKPMEFLARGVPVVASSHREYERLDEATGAVETHSDPEELVGSAVRLFDERRSGADLPSRLRAARLTMETGGGDAWEKALA